MKRGCWVCLILMWVVLAFLLHACSGDPQSIQGCGDGVCAAWESCETCPTDCPCGILAATPPMGWNSWNRYGCDIDEELIRETAEAMVSSGMKEAGYQYINIDDCWQTARDDEGTIIADPVRFPSGILALADYVHAQGLKFGLYTDAGRRTCQERPGSYGYEEIDARTYASWGVDYVKVDWCYSEGLRPRVRYAAMRDALKASGRRIVHSICNWGWDDPWVWGPETGQLWRTSADITDLYLSMLLNLRQAENWAAFAGPGHWNDPDMLEVGNGGMTGDQYRAHFSLWAMLAAPLIAGNDLTEMSPETLEILTNREVIAVNQDPAGIQGVKIKQEKSREVWAKPLSKPGERAVLFFNLAFTTDVRMEVAWNDMGLAPGEAEVRDLWTHEDLGVFEDKFSTVVRPTSVVMLKITGREPHPPPGEIWLSDLAWKHAVSTLSPVERDMSSGGSGSGDGKAITINGKSYDKGLGVSAASIILYHLGGNCSRFISDVGVDDEVDYMGSVAFEVWADGEKLFASGLMTGEMPAKKVNVPVSGKQELRLFVDAAGDNIWDDHADWADARLVCD